MRQPTGASFTKLWYDDIILFPLPGLHRLLVTLMKADRVAGMKAINFIIQERTAQLSQARRALLEISTQDLT
jgi:hypothetical protein